MWFRRKNTAFQSPYTPPTAPTSHRCTIPATTAASGIVDPIAPQAYDWLLNDADRLEAAAAEKEAQVQRDLSDAAEWRIVAASYRRIAAMHGPDAPRVEVQPEPEPQPVSVPSGPPSPIGCPCQWWRGESCEQCDRFVPQEVSVTTPWSPPEPDADTAVQPLVNGWTR